jgi:hypothetical protein
VESEKQEVTVATHPLPHRERGTARTTVWQWVGVVGLVGLGAGALASGRDDPAKDKAATDPWLPIQRIMDRKNPPKRVPTLFPESTLPDPDPNDPKSRENWSVQLGHLCPRLSGKVVLKIDPNDTDLQKLLKARLHQGTLEYQRRRAPITHWTLWEMNGFIECLLDMRAAATELWSERPNELALWLEEFLVVAKEFERAACARVENGSIPPQDFNARTRHRLELETALWKAKNGK